MKELEELIYLINLLVPEGTQRCADINGNTVVIDNSDDTVNITITSSNDSEIDDSVIEEISNYKQIIEELDDCLFMDVLDEMEEIIDIKRFNDLLEQEEFTNEEKEEVLEMINTSKGIIREHLQNKIEELVELFDKIAS